MFQSSNHLRVIHWKSFNQIFGAAIMSVGFLVLFRGPVGKETLYGILAWVAQPGCLPVTVQFCWWVTFFYKQFTVYCPCNHLNWLFVGGFSHWKHGIFSPGQRIRGCPTSPTPSHMGLSENRVPQSFEVYPLVICYIANWKIPIFKWKIHYFYGHFQ